MTRSHIVATVVAAVATAASTNCSLPARFRFLTGYGWGGYPWHNQQPFTSICSTPSLRQANETASQQPLGCMIQLESVFFEAASIVNASLQGFTLRPDYMEAWSALLPALTEMVANGSVTAFFLGDELVWNNVTWDQLDALSTLVKTAFPTTYVYYNEGFGPLAEHLNINGYHITYPWVPAALDAISMDDYRSVARAQQVYELYIYPRLNHTGQQVWLVPQTYGDPQPPSNITALDAAILADAEGYMAWTLNDTRIAGWNAFHLPTHGPGDYGLENLTQSLAWYTALGAELRQCLGAQ